MRKLTTLLFTTIIAFTTYTSAQAQITAGGGLMYGSEVEKLGLRADGTYKINEDFTAAASLGFYLPETQDFGNNNEIKTTWWEFNANVHYGFYADEESGLAAYALGGLNFMGWNTEASGPNVSGSNSDSELGLNIGAGAEYGVNFGNLFGELKYVIGDADQLNITAGVRIPIGN